MKAVYLVLAIAGALIPYVFFTQHIAAEGTSLPGTSLPNFVSALFANPAAGGFTADLLITSFVFWIAMFQRRGQPDAPSPWLFVVLNLAIGLSCAFPAYLYARERRLESAEVAA
jgi:TRAP-type uncharacterized transport system fused permease subunit